MNNLPYFFEIYVNGPKGQTGWEIKVGYVKDCIDKQAAINAIKAYFGKAFDCVIDCFLVSHIEKLECSEFSIIHANGKGGEFSGKLG